MMFSTARQLDEEPAATARSNGLTEEFEVALLGIQTVEVDVVLENHTGSDVPTDIVVIRGDETETTAAGFPVELSGDICFGYKQ